MHFKSLHFHFISFHFVVATADQNSMQDIRKCCDEGVHSEELILSGSSLYNIGIAFGWIYCITRLFSLCQGSFHYFVLLYDYPKYAIVIGPTRVT